MAPKFNRDALKGLTKTNGDFHLSHKFGCEIDSVMIGGIHKIDGIEFEAEVVEYSDGDDMLTHCRPGQLKPGRLMVERDHGNDKAFFTWRKAVIEGKTDRRSISVTLHNDKSDEARRINFYNCFPVKWTGPALNSHASGHASESLEIAFEELQMNK
ncbi:MAG TPA: phage tail protein [Myxococcales bacterium]|jgi:phage tail-like protein|nr:phage tail protein [Myxococcales bacterium]